MVAGQVVGFGISVVMIVIGIVLCIYSIYDRRKDAEEQAKQIASEIARIQAGKEGITASPIPLADLNDIIKAINQIKNPAMQVGVFLTVFGIIVMVISIFIPF